MPNAKQKTAFDDEFLDILASMIGRRGGAKIYAPEMPGKNLKVRLPITLQEVDTGATKQLTIQREENCPQCRGSGAAPHATPQTCPSCGGAGQLFQAAAMFAKSRPCPTCHGLGSLIPQKCPQCHGKGRATAQRTLQVQIPPGVESGAVIKLQAEGHAGHPGMPPGNLHVTLDLLPDPLLQRDGPDLICHLPLTITQAALGAPVQVPTIHATTTITIPPATQPGHTIRIPNLGLPKPDGTRGDLLIRPTIEIPQNPTPQQQAALQTLQQHHTPQTHPQQQTYHHLLTQHRPPTPA